MTGLNDWLDSRHERVDGSVAEIPTRWAVLERGCEAALAGHAVEVCGPSRSGLLVCDPWTLPLAEPVRAALTTAGLEMATYVVEAAADGSPPLADDARVSLLGAELDAGGPSLAVAVGSGTVNDLTKAATDARSLPYLVYGTAASMNGYTSGIAALYIDGLKSTAPARAPLGVYADPEVLRAAPRALTLAGLGDLCSKPFAGADAAVAAWISGGPPWRVPGEMVAEVFDRVLACAEGIGRGEPRTLSTLMEALWISGFSMTLAGSSAPASGGEHLWSHRLDMMRHDAGLSPISFHGAQVGVACGLVKPLFERVAALDPETVAGRLGDPPSEPDPAGPDFEAWLDARHPDLGPRSRAKVRDEAAGKYDPKSRRDFRAGVLERWPKIRGELLAAAHHAERVARALRQAGAPCEPADLGVSEPEAKRILAVCRDIRNRQTILDLAADLLDDAEG